jgi:hypothetical protein
MIRDAIKGHLEIEEELEMGGEKPRTSPVVAEAHAIYKVKRKDLDKGRDLRKFEIDFLKKEKVDIVRSFRMVEALYKEAVTLGVIPLKNPLDGIEVEIKIAKVVNSV